MCTRSFFLSKCERSVLGMQIIIVPWPSLEAPSLLEGVLCQATASQVIMEITQKLTKFATLDYEDRPI